MFQAFKSVMIGPHLYAGLTHNSRVLVADPADIASLVGPAPTEGVWRSASESAWWCCLLAPLWTVT